MDRSELENVLVQFESCFSDYTTLMISEDNRFGTEPEGQYVEGCFETAEYLYNMFSKTIISNEMTDASSETKISELCHIMNDDEEKVVYFEFLMDRGESHGMCFITCGDVVAVCQSLGGLFVAQHEWMNKTTFLEKLSRFTIDNDTFTHFGNVRVDEVREVKVSKRHVAHSGLLRTITDEEEIKLFLLRQEWLDEMATIPEFYALPDDYVTTRQPDLYPFVMGLQQRKHSIVKIESELYQYFLRLMSLSLVPRE